MTLMLPFSLLSLFSPLLPTGSFTWSQGLEKAVEDGIVTDADSLGGWVRDAAERGIACTELPLLIRMNGALVRGDDTAFLSLVSLNMAVRATAELRLEEYEKGRALFGILPSLGVDPAFFPESPQPWKGSGYLPLLSLAAVRLGIALQDLLRGFVFAYVETMVMAGAKTIPLGQSAAWREITAIIADIGPCIEAASAVPEDEIGAGLVRLAIESARHETMYSRIYRN